MKIDDTVFNYEYCIDQLHYYLITHPKCLQIKEGFSSFHSCTQWVLRYPLMQIEISVPNISFYEKWIVVVIIEQLSANNY